MGFMEEYSGIDFDGDNVFSIDIYSTHQSQENKMISIKNEWNSI